MRVLRHRAPRRRAGLHPAGPPRLDGRAGAARDPRLRPRESPARRRDHHERPLSERRPSERHQPDLARPRRRRAARLRREPRAPRRRRRRRARLDRSVPRGIPGGRDHPAREGGRGRADRARRLRPDPRPDPLEARDRRRLPRPDRRQRDRRAPAPGARRPARARDGRRHDARAPRLHRAAHARRARDPAAWRLRGGGHGRRGRVHGRAGAAEGADRDHRRRRRLRPDRLRPAAPRAGQLHLRADVLGLRLRGQVPDRPRPARSTTASTASSASTRLPGR